MPECHIVPELSRWQQLRHETYAYRNRTSFAVSMEHEIALSASD
jgi:hypothetical protein